jgi:hypothetical protein
MKYTKCQFENREEAVFCGECGSSLEIICPHCGARPPKSLKFCDQCGQDLGKPIRSAPRELSFDEKIAKIQRYLPEGLTEKILSQRDRIEGSASRSP